MLGIAPDGTLHAATSCTVPTADTLDRVFNATDAALRDSRHIG